MLLWARRKGHTRYFTALPKVTAGSPRMNVASASCGFATADWDLPTPHCHLERVRRLPNESKDPTCADIFTAVEKCCSTWSDRRPCASHGARAIGTMCARQTCKPVSPTGYVGQPPGPQQRSVFSRWGGGVCPAERSLQVSFCGTFLLSAEMPSPRDPSHPHR